ncbi:signal transduction histidine kinase [Gordonia amarae]|nr:histidine kinase [Gordonia amarae]MCS3876617.1 signal transduction histidine kinase [Gordonia amarae]
MDRMWSVPLRRTQLDDVRLTALFFAVGAALQIAGLNQVSGLLSDRFGSWLPWVTLTVAAAFQLLRRDRPAAALAGTTAVLTVDVVLCPTVAVWIIFSDIVYAVACYGSQRLVGRLYVLCAIVSAAVVVLLAAAEQPTQWRTVFVGILWVIALIFSPLAYGHALREHRTAAEVQRQHARTLATLADHERVEAVEEERRRLARDLHDVIAGQLSSIAVQSAAALDNPALSDRVLGSVRTISVEALREMRAMIDLLTDGTVDRSRATSTLRRADRLIEPVTGSGTDVELRCTPEVLDPPLPPLVDITAHHILAEALINATKHAPGQPISIDIDIAGDDLVLVVTNPLTDPPAEAEPAHTARGITNMTTRAAVAGGTLAAGPGDGAFTVTATLPLRTAGHPTDSAKEYP